MPNPNFVANKQKNIPHPPTVVPAKTMSNASNKRRNVKSNAQQICIASKQPETAQHRQEAQRQQQQQLAKKTASQQQQQPSRKKANPAPHMPTPRRTITPVKARRSERRKDINAMTECYEEAQADLELASPPSSSTESDDSDNGISSKRSQRRRKTQNVPSPSSFPPLNTKKKSSAREPSPRRRRSGSVADGYAGPTFNNAPAPSTLPMPAFLEAARAAATTTSIQLSPTHDQSTTQETYRQQSQYIMSILSVRQPSSHLFSKMATAHDVVDTRALEIQHGLKAMLKIQA